MKLRVKLFLPLLLASVLFTGYLYWVWMPQSIEHDEQQHAGAVAQHLETLAEGLVPLLLEDQLANIYDNLEAFLNKNPDWLAIQLRNENGQLLYPIGLAEPLVIESDARFFGENIRFLDTELGEIKLWVDFATYLDTTRTEHLQLSATLLAFLCTFLVLIAIVIEIFVRRPVQLLSTAASQLAEGDFSAPLPHTGHDEISTLAQSFDAMRTAIQGIQSDLLRENAEHRKAKDALFKEKERALVTLYSIADAVAVTNADGQVEYLNPVAEEMTGWLNGNARDLLISQVCPMILDDTKVAIESPALACLREGHIIAVTDGVALKHRRGDSIHIESTTAPIRDETGEIAGVVMVFRDVGAVREAHRDALHEREALLRSVVSSAPVILFAINRSGRLTFIEGSELEKLGIRRTPDSEQSVYTLFGDTPELRNDVARALRGEAFPSIFQVNDTIYECRYSPLKNRRGEVTSVIGIATDVTERKRVEERLNYLAYFDDLTGLPNRVLFNDRLQQAIGEANRFDHQVAVMFLDLDRFKAINDSLGHELADQLLVQVAHRLRSCVRAVDTVSRRGGDEFTVVIHPVERISDVTKITNKILDSFHKPFVIADREVFVTPSIGVTLFPDDANAIDDLLKNADTAMYHAKEKGRNTYEYYSPRMSAAASERLTIENSLRQAIDRGEMELNYQPQIDCKDGRIVGVEALLRWHHPKLGPVAPARFIPLAEESGLIITIGEWALHRACAQNRAWQDAGFGPIRMAVNLSFRQFRQENLVDSVITTLEKTGLQPQYLELELTEGILAHDIGAVSQTLQALGDHGVGITIDDFGTGYSSLNYLKRFPIDTLKIDRSFISEITSDPDASAITTAIIAMARRLRLKVIAEGMETPEQMSFLRKHDCDLAQGFLVSRPISADGIADLLAAGDRLHPYTERANPALTH